MRANLNAAIQYAQHHPFDVKQRVCAILIPVDKRGRNQSYWAIGYNKPKSHPLQKKFGRNVHSIFLHAEIDAIIQANREGYNISGARIFVARVLKDGTPALAKPCKGCQKALLQYEIEEVWYTTNGGDDYINLYEDD